VISMTVVLLIAGIGMLLAGLVTVGLGIELDLSFGNTLILTGAIVACTGMIMLALWVVIRELKNLALQLGSGVATTSRVATPQRSAAASTASRDQAAVGDGFPFGRDQPDAERPGDAEPADAPPAPSPAPWQDEAAARERARNDPPPVPPAAEAAPAAKPRRNLLFSSSSRKERDRAEARTPDPSAADVRSPPPAAPPPLKPSEAPPPPPPVTFDDAWPQSERSRTAEAPSQRRSGRAPSTFTEPGAGATGADRYSPVARNEEHPPVTVLKSGVVDGMAYSLYSDGSIEAQMPEGMMRFASIDELRAHLDQRP
jgi:hypothetical protein